MQFFPADIFGGVALGSGAVGAAITGAGTVNKVDFSTPEGVTSSFQAIFENVSAYNEANTTGVPLTERSTREKNSFFNSEDFTALKDKLTELGVAEKTVNTFLQQLAATSNNPTIGNMRSTVSDMLHKRASGEIDKQEMIQFSAFLGKLGFDSEELAELETLSTRGEGLAILKKIKEKISALQEEGKTVDITKEDLDALISACDLDSNANSQIMNFWENSGLIADNKLSLNKEAFNLMFGATMSALEIHNAEIVKLSENLEDGILSMLENKKKQAATEPVADMRGSALTERSETMAKIIATLLQEDDKNNEENSTSHLIDDKDANKLSKQESIIGKLLDNHNASRSANEERELLSKAAAAALAEGEEESLAAKAAADTVAESEKAKATATLAAGEKDSITGKAAGTILLEGEEEILAAKAAAATLTDNEKNSLLSKAAAAALGEGEEEAPADKATDNVSAADKASTAQQSDPKNAAYAAGQATPRSERSAGENSNQHTAAFRDIPSATESGLRAPEASSGETPENFDEKPAKNPFLAQQNEHNDTSAGKTALNSKVQEAPGMVFSAFSQTENSSAPAQASQSAQNTKAEIYHERIFEQVEKGILKNAIDGSRQIILRLDPPELGKLTLSLTVAQGEVKALIRTESAATTQVVSEQLAQLKQSLEEQGLKVASLEVETRAESQAGTDNWNGTEQHNHEQEMLEKSRFIRLARTRAREGETLAQSMQYVEQPASLSASGLHIIA